MTVWRSRGETVQQTEGIRLRAQFMISGQPVDLDAFPNITIVQPSGNVVLDHVSAGVYRVSEGVYGFDFITGLNTNIGVWSDLWYGTYNGIPLTPGFNFVVQNTMMPAINSDGYLHLLDFPGFNYSQTAIRNINLLAQTVKVRLNSQGIARARDAYGNIIYTNCDIFDINSIVSALANSITSFNQIPHFTYFTFEDTEIIAQFHDVLAQGAVIMLLAGKALIERGREYVIGDNGVSFQAPTISELLNSEWQTELTNFTEKVKIIKGNMKPSAISLGTFGITSQRHPAISRLRLLRERRII